MDLSRVQRDTARRDRRSSLAPVADSEGRARRSVRSFRPVIPGSEADRFFHERAGSGILVFFAVLLWSELEAPDGPRARWLAVALGGLMWTRPDAFVLAGAILLPHLWLNRGADGLRRAVLLRGGFFGGMLYLPWFAWAWWYYGSPIPNTIIAKPPSTRRAMCLICCSCL